MSSNSMDFNKNPINLQGNVTLTKITKNGEIKNRIKVNNTAVLNLFKGLGYHLIGSTDLGSKVYPQYLGLGYVDTSKEVLEPTALNQNNLQNPYEGVRLRLDKSGIIINEDNSISVKFSATIYYTTLLGQPVNEFGLFSSISGDNLLARIFIKDDGNPSTDDFEVIDKGESLVVIWEITINNMNSEVNG